MAEDRDRTAPFEEPRMATKGALTRRRLVRSLGAGAAGIAIAAAMPRLGRSAGAAAAEPTPTPKPDKEADPEPSRNEPTPTPLPGGTPVGSAGDFTLYSGRNESLLAPAVGRFEAETGIDVKIRYGHTSDLAVTILDAELEGEHLLREFRLVEPAGPKSSH